MDNPAPTELIDDRALESAADDRFRHEDIADELSDIISTVHPPASIALYGPWGSGKSGLANLLRVALEHVAPKSRFVRFDAFKYAETPLRRHFISQVAEALAITKDKYRQGLYRTEDRTELSIPGTQFRRLLGTFILVLLIVELVGLAIVVLISALSPGPFGDRFGDALDSGLALALAPAGILAAFVALVGQTLPIKRTTSAPSSDEQFEDLFKELVEDAKASPLVIFVDELDRCSPKEVVSTLEAIRTFLDVKGVVFVVAADQQVLERALCYAARQSTPADAVNPYYSAGSAYLDKVFQYQLPLPPLMARRLSGFALDLTQKLPGLWTEVDRDEVVSVLVPTHVSSPRRVKRLLNAFVVMYRLAKRRVAATRLEGEIAPRAAEIAKLVCLQIEFPLFAADLALAPRLPEYVLTVHDGGRDALPAYLPQEVGDRAIAYAEGRLAVDELLTGDGADRLDVTLGSKGSLSGDGGGTAESGTAADQPAPDDDGATSDDETTDGDADREVSEREAVRKEHAAQLIRYLQKTAHVAGPGRDLIHMESGGAMFGLDSAVADAVEDAAVNGDQRGVVQMVRRLEDAEHQGSALRLLAQRAKEASVGIEGQNVISSLLAVLSDPPELDLKGIADELADAVAAHETRYELRPDDLAGAFALGTMSGRAIGGRLIELVVERSEAAETDLGRRILAGAQSVPKGSRERMGEIAAAQLLASPAEVIGLLQGLPDATLQPILAATTEPLKEGLQPPEEE